MHNFACWGLFVFLHDLASIKPMITGNLMFWTFHPEPAGRDFHSYFWHLNINAPTAAMQRVHWKQKWLKDTVTLHVVEETLFYLVWEMLIIGHLFSHLFCLTGRRPYTLLLLLAYTFHSPIGLSPCTCWMQAASLAKTGLKTNRTFQKLFNILK